MDENMHLDDSTKNELIVYTVIILLVILSCYYKWTSRHFDRLAKKLNGPPSYPFIGVGLEFIGTPQQVMEKLIQMHEKYGPGPFKVWLGTSFAVFISKPEDHQIVLNSSNALEKSPFYNFFHDAVGEGLVTAPVDKWLKHRRLIAPVFNVSNLKHFFPIFNEKNQILIRNLKKELGKTQPFDLWDYIGPISLDIICQTAMGYNLDTQSNSESEFITAFIKGVDYLAMRIYKPWLYPNIIFSVYGRLIGLDKLYEDLNKLPIQVIKEKKEAYKQKKMAIKPNAIDVTDEEKNRLKVFLDMLLELNDSGSNFSDKDIRDEVMTMMIAGSETTALTLCFCLLLLAIHPDIQDKVYDEISEVLGDSDKIITIDQISKLIYLEQVLKETLRLYSTAPLILRKLVGDVKIASGNHTLPKGTTLVIAPINTHHIPELYPNPWSFNPENFNPENVAKRHKYSFIAFSGGPRGCVGSKYAMMSMKVLVSTVLRNFSLHTSCKLSDIKLKVDILIRSVHGYPVTLQPRDRRPTYQRN